MQVNWIIGRENYSLDDREYFYMLNKDGLLFPPSHRLTERGPLQNGETDLGVRLDPRFVTLKVGIRGTSLTDFYGKREILAKIFKPIETVGQLLLTIGTSQRQMDAHCVDIMEGERSYLWQEFAISLKASDPTLYDPLLQAVYFDLGGGSDTFEVPLVVPVLVGTDIIDDDKIVTYNGDVDSFPIIYIFGPITDPIITNTTLDVKLDFDGLTIGEGDWYKIDTRYGYKTVTDQDGENVIDYLSDDSDLAGFKISSEAVGGVNSFNVKGTGANQATSVKIEYYKRYIGV